MATKKARIGKETKRLLAQYEGMSDKSRSIVLGLIDRAAYMRVTLEDLEADLNEHGLTEKFAQGNQEPYDRKRPNAEIYNSMQGNYIKVIAQLDKLLPKADKAVSEDDTLGGFIAGRED